MLWDVHLNGLEYMTTLTSGHDDIVRGVHIQSCQVIFLIDL